MARLVLVGLPGAGKSTVAKELARRWDCASLDTDDLVAVTVGEAASEYLRRHGEPAFRVAELDALRDALGRDVVVATGAGIVTSEEGRALLIDTPTVWLDADDETLAERVRDGDRPLLSEDRVASLRALRATRRTWYEAVATTRVDATGSLEDVVTRVEHATGTAPS